MAENINDGEATDHLRPEVRSAVEYCDEVFDDCDNGEWATVRAELERQAAEIAELRAKSAERDSHDLTDCMHEMCIELADAGVIRPGVAPMFVVDAVLALKHERDELRAKLDDPGTTHSEGCWTWGPKHYGCAEHRIKELEAELAAMRAKWDAARVIEPWKYWDDRDLPQAFRGTQGRRVRLVVEDSE